MSQEVRIGGAIQPVPNGGMTPPKVVSYSPPAYTPQARAARIEGVVTVQAEFDIDGNFKVLGIIKGLGYGLDEKALEALQSWRFSPAYRSGAAVSVIAEIEVAFKSPAPDSDLYIQGMQWMDKGRYKEARILFQTLLSTFPDSKYASQTEYAFADSYYREGAREALVRARRRFEEYLAFFPDGPQRSDASKKLLEIQQRLDRK